MFSTLQSLYKAISGHSQPEGYKQPAVLSDGQVWIPLGRAVFLEADFRTSEVGDTAMNVFKVLVLLLQILFVNFLVQGSQTQSKDRK